MPDTVFISRLTVDIPSQLRLGHVHRAGTEIAPIKRVGDCWLVEIRTPDGDDFWYEELMIQTGQSEVVEVPESLEGMNDDPREEDAGS